MLGGMSHARRAIYRFKHRVLFWYTGQCNFYFLVSMKKVLRGASYTGHTKLIITSTFSNTIGPCSTGKFTRAVLNMHFAGLVIIPWRFRHWNDWCKSRSAYVLSKLLSIMLVVLLNLKLVIRNSRSPQEVSHFQDVWRTNNLYKYRLHSALKNFFLGICERNFEG